MLTPHSFIDLENLMAARMSVIRAARQREQRDQIGTMLSDLSQSLLQLEINCLVRTSDAAREAHQPQIALNSIMNARQLDTSSQFEVSDEFSNVLWHQGEQKYAVNFLKSELAKKGNDAQRHDNYQAKIQEACLLARLVCSCV